MYTVLTTINVLEVQLEDYTFTYPVIPSVNTSLDANNKLEPFSFDVDDINDDDVKDILKSLQTGKASGGDFISHQMLKNTADTVFINNYIVGNRVY
jgi:hypothetical protein